MARIVRVKNAGANAPATSTPSLSSFAAGLPLTRDSAVRLFQIWQDLEQRRVTARATYDFAVIDSYKASYEAQLASNAVNAAATLARTDYYAFVSELKKALKSTSSSSSTGLNAIPAPLATNVLIGRR